MPAISRLQIKIHGAVQGVGFRPFVFRLATEHDLKGWVLNSSQGVLIDIEGSASTLDLFQNDLKTQIPANAYIQSYEVTHLNPAGHDRFDIRESQEEGSKSVLVLPDISTCPQCLNEIRDPTDRRYQYPFTNCTLCGPRYSIIQSLPYDRAKTTMNSFTMCESCKAEYQDPTDRRFHAQPNACPDCGPRLSFWDQNGMNLAEQQNALEQATQALLRQKIIAIKGIGGFHLAVDARNGSSIERLRQRKKRNEKPFAVMVPTIETIIDEFEVSQKEKESLLSPAAPIVILNRKPNIPNPLISPSVAPGNITVGVFLPYTPLHHLLMDQVGIPLVMTSGNLSDEPICIDEVEALNCLKEIADYFLVHNRPIERPVDDSVVRIILGRELIIRRSRGYAPLPIVINTEGSGMALGAHQKNTVALQANTNIFVSQHIGDLETLVSYDAFKHTVSALGELYGAPLNSFVCDLHPEYLSTKFAKESGQPIIQVQHHQAHVASCIAENQLEGEVLGVAWDGAGLGPDGTLWGGEFFRVNNLSFDRLIHYRPFPLPGGEAAIKEPRLAALGLIFAARGADTLSYIEKNNLLSFDSSTLAIKLKMMEQSFNSPVTTSVGRLFDAVAALIGIRDRATFEGQAAIELEHWIDKSIKIETYPIEIEKDINWELMIEAIVHDDQDQVDKGVISAKFHNTLAKTIVEVAKRTNLSNIALSGGCFQNRYLTETAVSRLKDEGFQPYWHQRVPPNDGGISLGQLAIANANFNQ